MLLRTLLAIVFVEAAAQDVGDFVSNFIKLEGKRENKSRPFARIVNGFEVKPPYSIPFMAFLRIDDIPDKKYLCGASLLNARYAITAAHCVDPEYKDLFNLFAHRHNKNLGSKEEGGTAHRLADLIIHEKYEVLPSGVPLNDIAVLKLSSPVKQINTFVRLATPKTPLPSSKTPLTVIGWGLTFTNGDDSDELQMADSLHLTKQCYKTKPGLTEDLHLCAVGDFGMDACTNDSGGPLILPVKDGYLQIGIVSTGAACGVFNEPGIYTRISTQFNWIRAATQRLK